VNGFIASAVSSDFVEQLSIAIVTGVISAVGVVLGAYVTTRRNRDILEDHTKKLDQLAKSVKASDNTEQIDELSQTVKDSNS